MPHRTLDFKCAIITGGAGGLGRAIADYLVKQEGKKVILVGRTEASLKVAAQELGQTYYVLDTGSIKDIEPFVQRVVKEHPEVDCLINNAGVQRPLDVLNFDLAAFDQEIDINVRGPIHLATHLLPHFRSKEYACIMNVSSVLGFVPYSILNCNYNGTKAAVHFWSMAQRVQLKHTPIRIIEIVPPSVATDLHRDRVDPKDSHKNPNSLTVEQFMEDLIAGWKSDADTVAAGSGKDLVKRWNAEFGAQFEQAAQAWKGFPTKD